MNVRKTIFIFSGIGLILILLAIRLGGLNVLQKQKNASQKTSVSQSAAQPAADVMPAKAVEEEIKTSETPPAVSAQSLPAEKKAEKPAEENLLGSGDPFVYSTAGTGDFTSFSGNKNVGAITVKGIIHIDGEEPKAILHLKDTDRVHYVSKDSVVRVNTGNKNGSSPAEAYIVVKDIRNDEVELIQLERPDKVIIIR